MVYSTDREVIPEHKNPLTENHFDKIFSEKEKIDYRIDLRNMGPKDKKIYQLLEQNGVRGKRCLDVGPGTGRWLNFLRQLGAESLYAVDISEQALNRCKPICNAVHKLNFEKEAFSFESDSFDIVISFEVLEHLYDPRLFLSEILRVLRHGGLLIMSTPNMTSLISRARMVMGALPVAIASDPTHVRFYRKKDIMELFKRFSLNPEFIPTSISLNPLNPKSRFRIPSSLRISSLDDSLVFYVRSNKKS